MAGNSKNYPKKTNMDQMLDYGKMPPQALDLEEAVLGAIMLEKDAIIAVMDIIRPESFYKEGHQKIFKAVLDLSQELQPIDILTVTEELRKRNELDVVGGPFYITQLASKVSSAAHIEYHARIIAQKHIQRELIRVSTEIQGRAYDDSIDVNDLIDFSESELFKVAEGNIKKETTKINLIIQEAITQIEEAAKREDGLSGVPSGYTKLDRVTSGWQRSDLVIIAARPSMGKTAFVLNMALKAIERNEGVAFFSLEMPAEQLMLRLLSAKTSIPLQALRVGDVKDEQWSQLSAETQDLSQKKLFVDDGGYATIHHVRSKLRKLKGQHPEISVAIIDYLQLMSGEGKEGRQQEVSEISRGLKQLARELQIPIVALSQLNR